MKKQRKLKLKKIYIYIQNENKETVTEGEITSKEREEKEKKKSRSEVNLGRKFTNIKLTYAAPPLPGVCVCGMGGGGSFTNYLISNHSRASLLN